MTAPELKGAVVVADESADLAIVRITPPADTKLHQLQFGAADMFLAERVIAIGSPYGYEGTVSVGIISALNREITMPNDVVMTGLIQHNAAINPGNSGGPLININEEVIGINVAMRDGAQNIAFAINASTVETFLNKHLNAKVVAGIEHGIKCEETVVAEVGDRQHVVVKNAASRGAESGRPDRDHRRIQGRQRVRCRAGLVEQEAGRSGRSKGGPGESTGQRDVDLGRQSRGRTGGSSLTGDFRGSSPRRHHGKRAAGHAAVTPQPIAREEAKPTGRNPWAFLLAFRTITPDPRCLAPRRRRGWALCPPASSRRG